MHLSTHSLISLSAGLFQNPLMLIKIFLLLGFRQVSPVPHPDVCSFPATPPELVFPDIWLYPLFCLLAVVLRGDVLHRNPFRITEDLPYLTSPHLCNVDIICRSRPSNLPFSSTERNRCFKDTIHFSCFAFSPPPPPFIMIQWIVSRKCLLLPLVHE